MTVARRSLPIAGGALGLLLLAPSALADDPVIAGRQATPDAARQIGMSEIRVGGNRTRYNKIETSSFNLWVEITGHPPARAVGEGTHTMTINGKAFDLDQPDREARLYRLKAPFAVPRDNTFRLRQFCNDELNKRSGDEKTRFLQEGGEFYIGDAYTADLSSSWLVRARQSGVFQDPPSRQTWTGEFPVGAAVICVALDPNAGAVRTSVPRRANPPAPDPADLPRLKTATLDIAPYAVERVGNFRCPTKLRLRGFIETNKRMRGQVVIFGPAFIAPPKKFDFDDAHTMNHIATYDMKWEADTGSLAANTSSPSRQDLTFKMNVLNGRDKIVKTIERSIRVTCE